MADTNAFNPAGFYGVAFEHLPLDAALAVVEPVDTLVAAALRGEIFTLALTDPVDTMAAVTGIVAVCDFATTEGADVLIADVSSITHASLAVTEDFFDTLTADTIAAHLLDIALVELADVVEAELATTADMDLAVTETAFDVMAAQAGIIAFADLAVVEDRDVVTAKAGRWEFFYVDSEAIRVAWEEQLVVVPGRPRGGEATFHPFITAFYEQAFDNNGFFTGSGAFHYTDDEAVHVPAPAVTERLREDRKSYVAPRRRV